MGSQVTRSETRRELVRIAWKARVRANRALGTLERCKGWQEQFSAMIAYRKLDRFLQEVQA